MVHFIGIKQKMISFIGHLISYLLSGISATTCPVKSSVCCNPAVAALCRGRERVGEGFAAKWPIVTSVSWVALK